MSDNFWEAVTFTEDSPPYPEGVFRQVLKLRQGVSAVEALQALFPEGQATTQAYVLFFPLDDPVSARHLSEIKGQALGKKRINFTILQPHEQVARYGTAWPKSSADIEFLVSLQLSSFSVAEGLDL